MREWPHGKIMLRIYSISSPEDMEALKKLYLPKGYGSITAHNFADPEVIYGRSPRQMAAKEHGFKGVLIFYATDSTNVAFEAPFVTIEEQNAAYAAMASFGWYLNDMTPQEEALAKSAKISACPGYVEARYGCKNCGEEHP